MKQSWNVRRSQKQIVEHRHADTGRALSYEKPPEHEPYGCECYHDDKRPNCLTVLFVDFSIVVLDAYPHRALRAGTMPCRGALGLVLTHAANTM